jgi:ribosomal protein S18 acetylase RimI-like enzyme
MRQTIPERVRIDRLGPDDNGRVVDAAACFNHPPRPDATERFLRSPDHHLLVAYVGDEPVGMVTGVEMTHPDKGTEMFLYELGVREGFRSRGIGRALVARLADLAIERGCYGMWVLTDDDNPAALRAYTAAGGRVGGQPRGIDWTFSPPS